MLSDEEKKAVELLEDYLICGNKEGVLCRNLRIISTIIEKQQKEIEKLKLKIGDEKTFIQLGECIGEKEVKDKIKAKIEELEKLDIYEFETINVIEVLKSLLRKEFPVTITKKELEKKMEGLDIWTTI